MMNCERCNSDALVKLESGEYECNACGAIFSPTAAAKYADVVAQYLTEIEQKTIANARKNLWNEVNKTYLSNIEILKGANEILKYLPTDFYATLYKTVCGGNTKQLNEFINAIDISEHYSEIEYVVKFVLKAVVEESLLCLNNIIDRAYKEKDLELYEKMNTTLAKRAKEVNEGIYNLNLTRDVFVAYRSDDMELVEKVVSAIESAGLSCFVSMRNLQHGRGAVDNYQSALERAIDNCKTFLFVSTERSRNFSCDAVKFEIPYLRTSDLQKNPMYRDSYDTMPLKYKKFRVQLVFGAVPGTVNAADRHVNSIFYGYEYAYSIDESVDRICQSITTRLIEGIKDSDEKICLNCGTENKTAAKECIKCGRVEFCETIDEYRDHITEKTNRLMQEKAELDKKMEEEKAALLAQIEELKQKAERVKDPISEERAGVFVSGGATYTTGGEGGDKNADTSKADSVESLLVNARYLLEEEDYDGVARVCDEIYKLDSENSELWVLRTLVEVRQNRLYKVARLSVDLTRSINFQKAVRYGKGEEIEKLKKFVAQALKNYSELGNNRDGLWTKKTETKKIAEIIDDKRKKIEAELDRRKKEIEAQKQRDAEARAEKELNRNVCSKYIGKSLFNIALAIILIVLQCYAMEACESLEYTDVIATTIILMVALFVFFGLISALNKKFKKENKLATNNKLKVRYIIMPITTILSIVMWICQIISIVYWIIGAIDVFPLIFG